MQFPIEKFTFLNYLALHCPKLNLSFLSHLAYTQQIIINSSEELLKEPFLPLAERVKKRTDNMFHKEESLRGFIKSSSDDTSQVRNW
jgi:ryanodine receptor 2